jgi:CRP-like cAMP-binding protein
LLGHASNSELDSLLSSKKTKKVALDAFVYRANDPAEAFYYIKSGAFKIVDSQSGVASRKSEGQLIGHTDFLSKTDRTESAQCVSVGSEGKAVLVAFPRSALLYILGKRHDFAVSDSEDSDSEDESKDQDEDVSSPPPHAIVRFDDVFCGAARLP